jgi:PAS domain S-box-containing protein
MSEREVDEKEATWPIFSPSLGRVAVATTAVAFGLLYFLGSKTGLELALVHPSATALWPGTGIAVAGLLVLGLRLWPVVLLSSAAVNYTTTGDAPTSIAIAGGNTMEALIIGFLLQRFGDGVRSFERAAGVFLFVGAVAFAALLSATIGAGSLVVGGLAAPELLPQLWTNWWIGNVTGALLVAPLLVLWSRNEPANRSLSRWIEGGLLFGLIVTVAFDPARFLTGSASPNPPTGLLVLPLVIWSAFRFSPRVATAAVFVLALGLVWNTVQGRGPYARSDATDSLLVLAMALGALSFVSLVLAALVTDRRREAETLRQARDQLEARVDERTESLSVAVERLRSEIGERERAEEDLRRSRARLVEAQQLARMGSWDWDVDRNVVSASEELHRLYGLTRAEFPTSLEGFLSRIHPDDRPLATAELMRARETGRPFEFDHRILRPDGAPRWFRSQGRVELGPDGRALRMSGTAQDITDRRRLERERQDAQERAKEVQRLQELNELKTRFMNTAAHELNTPLTPIRVQLHLLRNRLDVKGDPDTARSFDVLERNIERMIGLVGDVLEAARLQAERLGIRKEPVDLTRLAREAFESFQAPARESGLQLEPAFNGGLLVEADPKRISQVLYNLLSNAIKFTPAGGHVRVETRSSVGGGEVCVTDTGIGLTHEQIDRLFQPFSQVHEGIVTSRPGTGLGLYISRGIAELHGGSIRAESAGPGRGTTFILTLPLVEKPTEAPEPPASTPS